MLLLDTVGCINHQPKKFQILEYLALYGERPLSLCVFLMMLMRLYLSVTVLDIIYYWIKQFTGVTLMLDRCGTEKNPLLMTL